MLRLRNSPTRLTTRSPSPTTTLYTVSNAPRRPTLISRATHWLHLLARALLALLLVLLIIAVAAEVFAGGTVPLPGTRGNERYAGQVHDLAHEYGIAGSKRVTWLAMGLCGSILWLLSRRDSYEESLLVIRGLGIQISTCSPTYMSTTTTRFIPSTQIQDIFIHEAFVGFEVKFYLAAIVENEKEAVVVFPKLMPRRDILEEVWRGAKSVLYQQPKK